MLHNFSLLKYRVWNNLSNKFKKEDNLKRCTENGFWLLKGTLKVKSNFVLTVQNTL